MSEISSWHMDEAYALQQSVIDSEPEQLRDGLDKYPKEYVNQATVHTRQAFS